MRTTSSLAGSVPTNLACVTASAMFSMASAAASWLASVNMQETQFSQKDDIENSNLKSNMIQLINESF